jgi:hypothetical protein
MAFDLRPASLSLRSMKTIIYLFLAVSILSCNKKETITAEEAELTIRNFDGAWKNKNAKGVDSVLADRYLYFTQSGGVFDRANLINTAGSPEYKLDFEEREVISVAIQGNTAVVNTTWKGRGTYYGKPFDDYQRCSVTLVKVSGKVRVLSEHCTPIETGPANN